MKRFYFLLVILSTISAPLTWAQTSSLCTRASSLSGAQELPKAVPVALRELHGIKLNMSRDKVREQLRKPNQPTEHFDEFKLEGGDILTVHYGPKGLVKVIQLYCTDNKRAPAWVDVVGDAQVQEHPNGAKFARQDVSSENFWVTMYQSKSGEVTTITISRIDK